MADAGLSGEGDPRDLPHLTPMRILRVLWALPNTLLGLALGLVALPGGGARFNRGVIEVSGPALSWLLRNLVPIPGGARAMTLGHVILGRDTQCLHECGDHERVHVSQYERWGPLFLPAYLVSSLLALFRGDDPYLGNRFEREAYGLEAVEADEAPGVSAAAEPPIRILAAFGAIYLIWGSTYLAIRFAVETLPPFLMLATRFGVAGVLLFGWLRLRGMPVPPRREWAGSAAVGGLLLVGGTGAVGWAEQWIPSGLAALIVTIVPVWMVLLDWLRPGGQKPTGPVVAGLIMGFAGVAILIGPVELGGGGRMQYLGALVVVFGTISWATGSVLGSRFPHPPAPRMAAALQMMMGGLLLLLLGSVVGEWSRLDPSAISTKSVASLAYLVVFGSIIAFAAYVYLLKVSTPARVGSYAYVNPVVAVFLGWALADEPVTLRVILAAAIIITGVVLIVSRRAPRPLPESPAADDTG
ncbi:MAG: EamA family transporter [marine benthic group bacterium]|nr:EamA family transporter [Gemmatimonadota bacterium]MCL7937729.1 EamA family transporter [Gemmatimonadota bacterium]MCL7965946.1 EamA family transporter [Gemmatimonadota bacterium]MCL7974985.1 EamA family transporter [Gemmatimonadota bacterium]MCL7976247.1 EamA family transporter [Gemmatimonadota bacterium]